MKKLLLIAAGGAAGALLRYAVAALFGGGSSFPWGTLAANLLGCFTIGFLWTLRRPLALSPDGAAFLFVGLLGAFTTFSTYGLESVRLLRGGAWLQGAAYLLASNALGLGLVALGMAAARHLLLPGSA